MKQEDLDFFKENGYLVIQVGASALLAIAARGLFVIRSDPSTIKVVLFSGIMVMVLTGLYQLFSIAGVVPDIGVIHPVGILALSVAMGAFEWCRENRRWWRVPLVTRAFPNRCQICELESVLPFARKLSITRKLAFRRHLRETRTHYLRR